MTRTDLDAHTLARSLRRMAGDGSVEWVMEPIQADVLRDIADMLDENAELREQMERLVTLLRVDCDIEASWDGLRKFWSIELTENGCLMRDRACKAEAENAKLRDELDQWHRLTAGIELPEYPITEFKPKDLERENAKMRELLEAVLQCAGETKRDKGCDACPMYNGPWRNDGTWCLLRPTLRELGVEVDG